VFGFDTDTNCPKARELTATGGELLKLYQRQAIGSGLALMFEGDDGAAATVDDEWEIEVYGAAVEVDNSGIGSMKSSRY
jgi:hypothetical protein